MMSPQKDTIYIYSPETNTFIPYRPDYNAGVPFTTAESISVAQSKKSPRGPKQNKELGVIVPLIKQRPNQSDYVQLATIAQKYPRVNTIAVISPTNDERGIGDIGPDAEYQNAIRFLQNAGVQVVGYLDADLARKAQEDIKREIDNWRQWYPDIDGLFFENDSHPAEYAKVDKGFRIIIAGIGCISQSGVINRTDDIVSYNKAVDIFVTYEREGYPADGWYPSIRKDWMSQYPRSKFAFIPYRVPEDTLACRNFIDKVVGIEKLAGYVYVHSAHETDRRKMKEWTNISSLLEVTLDQLDRMAQQEGIPSTKGVVPDTMKPIVTTQGEAIATRNDESGIVVSTPEQGLPAEDMDKFGIRKVYPNAKDKASQEWYIFMDNPRTDSRLKGLPDRLEKQADGSWQSTDNDVELSVIGPTAKKGETYLNVEMTGYFKPVQLPKKGKILTQFYAKRSGSVGTGYQGHLLKDGAVSVIKFMGKDGTTGNRGTTQATNNDLLNRWIGMKFMVYNNLRINQRTNKEETFVTMEIWIDDNVSDQDGNLVIKNDWHHIMTVHDQGAWFTKKTTTTKTKKKIKNEKQNDKVLISPGDSVAWSWSNSTVINWKFLSVREIDVIHRD
jgi:hypothetical protein